MRIGNKVKREQVITGVYFIPESMDLSNQPKRLRHIVAGFCSVEFALTEYEYQNREAIQEEEERRISAPTKHNGNAAAGTYFDSNGNLIVSQQRTNVLGYSSIMPFSKVWVSGTNYFPPLSIKKFGDDKGTLRRCKKPHVIKYFESESKKYFPVDKGKYFLKSEENEQDLIMVDGEVVPIQITATRLAKKLKKTHLASAWMNKHRLRAAVLVMFANYDYEDARRIVRDPHDFHNAVMMEEVL